MHKSHASRAAIAAAIAIIGCGGGADLPTSTNNNNTQTGTNTNVVTSVVISPSNVPALVAGSTVTLSASATNSLGLAVTSATITWSSSASSIASVSGGVVTGVAAGTAQITAASGTVSATVSVTVTPPVTTTGETLATLPQTYLNTAAPPAPDAGGQVITVATATAFQNALNSANYGDVIAIQNGVTLTGNFSLANRGASNNGKWITIRPATMTGMPAEGARMTPTIAAALRLPIILSPNTLGAIATSPNSHHIRLIGLEVSQVSTVTSTTGGLVRLGEDGTNAQTSLATVPHDFVLDRMYIHGLSNQNTRRCVGLNSASSAVIDSYLSDCHENGSDAQAIHGFNGPGPFKIVNNYLEASGENIMFGGADPNIPNLTPSDIEIRHNHFYKPTSWKGSAFHWTVKNLFELKHAQRVLVEGNLFENNWTDGQSGTAIALKTVNQNGTCTWCVTQDITFRYNLVRNVGGAFTVSGSPDNAFQDIPARRLTITDNIVHSINTGIYDGIGQGALLNGDVSDLVFAHNTIVDPPNFALEFGGTTSQPMIRLSFRDNIIGGGIYGMKGNGTTAGTTSLNSFAPSAKVTGNVITLANSAGYPTGNFYPTSLTGISFLAVTTFDFHLLNTSPFKAKASDGVDPGANVDAVLSAIAGVIVP